MGTLYLVRHGQASLGAYDYDNLSDLGQRQSLRLGQYFAGHGLQFEAVLTGGMKRHAQTWAGIQVGLGGEAAALEASVWPGLNEYDSEAVITSVHPAAHAAPVTPQGYREHFRLLRQGLEQWAAGAVQPAGMPSYPEFVAGIGAALDHVRTRYTGNVLLVSSGGPISTAVAQVLKSPAQTFVDLNMRIRNTAVTEFAFNPKRHVLLSFNSLAHLEPPQYTDWQTYA